MKYPGMKFSKDELLANEIFIKMREKTLLKEIPSDFLTNTYKYLENFPKYSMFSIIKEIPKTSLFHLHVDISVKQEWFIKIINEYKDNIYRNVEGNYFYF
jgi:hypothetical protein